AKHKDAVGGGGIGSAYGKAAGTGRGDGAYKSVQRRAFDDDPLSGLGAADRGPGAAPSAPAKSRAADQAAMPAAEPPPPGEPESAAGADEEKAAAPAPAASRAVHKSAKKPARDDEGEMAEREQDAVANQPAPSRATPKGYAAGPSAPAAAAA